MALGSSPFGLVYPTQNKNNITFTSSLSYHLGKVSDMYNMSVLKNDKTINLGISSVYESYVFMGLGVLKHEFRWTHYYLFPLL